MVAAIDQIKRMLERGIPPADIIALTGVHAYTIHRIQSEMATIAVKTRTSNGQAPRWTDEMDERLRELVAKGLSAKQIALELRIGKSRNAIIGRMHRIRIAGRTSWGGAEHPKRVRVSKPRAPKKPKQPNYSIFSARRAQAMPQSLPAEPLPPAIEPVIPVDQRITIDTLENHHCRWPYGDAGSFHFCGKQKVVGLAYCQQHSARAFYAPRPRGARPAPAPKPEPIPTFADAIAEDLKV